MSAENNSLLVAFTGYPGVGKTTVARHLDSYIMSESEHDVEDKFREIRAVSMRQLLGWHGYEGGNQFEELRKYHEKIREQGEAQQVLGRLSLLREGVFITDSLRNIDDIDYFKNELGGFVIGLVAEEQIRKCRLMADKDDEKHFGAYYIHELHSATSDGSNDTEKMQRARQLAWDQESEEARTGGMADCLNEADYLINAEQDAVVVSGDVLQCIVKYTQVQILNR